MRKQPRCNGRPNCSRGWSSASRATSARWRRCSCDARPPRRATRRRFRRSSPRTFPTTSPAEFDALLAGHAGPVEGGASAVTLDTALVDDATRRLAAYVGPIARIVASRAASRTNDAGTFYLRLVDAVPDEKDKAALRRELGLSAD